MEICSKTFYPIYKYSFSQQLPFYLLGGLGLTFGTLLAFALPPGEVGAGSKAESKEDVTSLRTLTLGQALLSPEILFPFVDQMALHLGIGFVESMLEPHARTEVGMSKLEVGAVFLCWGTVYTLVAPTMGRVCDVRVRVEICISYSFFRFWTNWKRLSKKRPYRWLEMPSPPLLRLL